MADPRPYRSWPRRLGQSFADPRPSPGRLLAGVLCGLLGFAAVVQVRAHDAGDRLAGARESDLVMILDSVREQEQRLQDEQRELLTTRDRLQSGADRDQAALEEAVKRAEILGILAGTRPATGPGIRLTVTDPAGVVAADLLLNALQELRDAGAEAIEVNDVRVVASTDLVDGPPGVVLVDGRRITSPYVLTAIGDPATLSTALDIPGGLLDSLAERDAEGVVTERESVVVDAVRRPEPMLHARASREGAGP